MAWPTVEPCCYRMTLLISIIDMIVVGGSAPYPLMMLTTPGGNPASCIKLVSLSAVSGVTSEGF